jgi:hypothetical protein
MVAIPQIAKVNFLVQTGETSEVEASSKPFKFSHSQWSQIQGNRSVVCDAVLRELGSAVNFSNLFQIGAGVFTGMVVMRLYVKALVTFKRFRMLGPVLAAMGMGAWLVEGAVRYGQAFQAIYNIRKGSSVVEAENAGRLLGQSLVTDTKRILICAGTVGTLSYMAKRAAQRISVSRRLEESAQPEVVKAEVISIKHHDGRVEILKPPRGIESQDWGIKNLPAPPKNRLPVKRSPAPAVESVVVYLGGTIASGTQAGASVPMMMAGFGGGDDPTSPLYVDDSIFSQIDLAAQDFDMIRVAELAEQALDRASSPEEYAALVMRLLRGHVQTRDVLYLGAGAYDGNSDLLIDNWYVERELLRGDLVSGDYNRGELALKILGAALKQRLDGAKELLVEVLPHLDEDVQMDADVWVETYAPDISKSTAN